MTSSFLSAYAQEEEFHLFRSVIQELYTETQTQKDAMLEAYKTSDKEVEPYKNRKPNVSVFGMDPTKAKELEENIEEIISEEKPNKSTKPKKQKARQSKIKFKQVHMQQDKGEALPPAHEEKPREIKWVSSEVESFEYEEIIVHDEISPEQQKEFAAIGQHNANAIALNKIGFIEAIYNETKTIDAYKKFKSELNQVGFDIDPIVKRSKVLERNEQHAYYKSKLTDIIHKIVNK